MQDMFVEILLIAAFAIGVGTVSSMVGIGGGIINTPLLIIIFGLTAQTAPATALVAALFVAAASTVPYYRQKPRPIMLKAGLFLAIMTIPGSLVGVALRELILDDYVLRLIFGVALFPVAIKMLFAKKKGKADEISSFKFSELSNSRLILSLVGGFIGGISAGLLGIGGGAVVVPVLIILMGVPIHAAVATSMFTMIFTASAGTVRNIIGGHIDPFYVLALGIGMIVGAQIGPKLASRVNAVQLKQVFGLILVFPLVKMMYLGQMLLDPLNQSFLMAIIGDIIIWLAIIIPIGVLRFYQIRGEQPQISQEPTEVPSPE
ncbi:MAG: sulfite exporter TauE/SafE family protein [Candidatus Thorarchaeota archaeon]|nr:sulfite exporter TauE/SafE family protein [Candidatus Thorarchaeota archaeon]